MVRCLVPFLGQHGEELLLRPVNLARRDHQRRRDAERVGVGFLAQDAAILQRLAIMPGATGFGLQFRRNHQAAAAHPLAVM